MKLLVVGKGAIVQTFPSPRHTEQTHTMRLARAHTHTNSNLVLSRVRGSETPQNFHKSFVLRSTLGESNRVCEARAKLQWAEPSPSLRPSAMVVCTAVTGMSECALMKPPHSYEVGTDAKGQPT